jgi:molybdenum cofactor cytidylyltransferase
MTQKRIAAIVLSGGKSERMGSPKALLRFRGATFLERILSTIRAAGIDDVVVVAGHHHRAITDAFPALPVINNPNYELGMSTSVQAGLRALSRDIEAAAIFLVDHPLIDSLTVRRLCASIAPGRILLPVHKGRRGHPIVLASDLFAEVLDLPSELGLNFVVRRIRDRVLEVEVDDAGVLQDVDTPEQYAKLIDEDAEQDSVS